MSRCPLCGSKECCGEQMSEEIAALTSRVAELDKLHTEAAGLAGGLHKENAQLRAGLAAAGVCQWQEDEDGHYDTSCGNRHSFIEGGPDDNGQKFCPYCGKRSEQLWFNDWPEGESNG